MKRYRTVLLLAGAVLACALYILYDHSAATTDELEARRQNLFPAFHRDRVDRIEVNAPTGTWELRKRGEDWLVVSGGNGRKADPVEVERLLSEVEGAEPARRLGTPDAASRGRFGLDHPRARVVVHERDRVVAGFSVGAAVPGEETAYVESDHHAVVLPRSFAEAFDRPASDLREKAVVELDPSRIDRLVVTSGDTSKRLERRGPVWRLVQPDLGRAARGAVDAVTSELHTLNATRFLSDDTSDATLARYGLAPPAVRLEIGRGAGTPVVLRFGGACPGHDGEYTATREGSGSVFCVGRALADAVRVPAEGFRDDHLVAARTDEVSRVHVHGPGTVDMTVHRTGDGWAAEGTTYPVDAEAVESWLNTLHDIAAGQRLPGDARAAHGLAPPSVTLEISRTGVDGVERVNVGAADATGLYVTRDDEPLVLQFPPSAAETLVVDAIRFRPKRLVHDAEDDLQALLLDAGTLHEQLARVDGAWRLAQPVQAAADPGLVRDLARLLANLDADRWVSPTARPEFGLASPRARLVARFEGPGAHEDATGADAGADGGVSRVRTYTLTLGAPAPGGGLYATLEGTAGVFALPRTLLDAVTTPHIDRAALQIPHEGVSRLAIVGPGPRRVVLVRDGERWRTEGGTPADQGRVGDLLDRLAGVSAPRVFGYGPAPADARLGATSFEATVTGDAGATLMRVVLGDRFGVGEASGFYARRDGLDATLSLPSDVVDALQEFRP